jgi:hypothetical protein
VVPGQKSVVAGKVQSAFARGLWCCGAWRQFVVMVQANVEHHKLQLLSAFQVHNEFIVINLLSGNLETKTDLLIFWQKVLI